METKYPCYAAVMRAVYTGTHLQTVKFFNAGSKNGICWTKAPPFEQMLGVLRVSLNLFLLNFILLPKCFPLHFNTIDYKK